MTTKHDVEIWTAEMIARADYFVACRWRPYGQSIKIENLPSLDAAREAAKELPGRTVMIYAIVERQSVHVENIERRKYRAEHPLRRLDFLAALAKRRGRDRHEPT